MEVLRNKYSLWFLLICSFFTTTLDAQYDWHNSLYKDVSNSRDLQIKSILGCVVAYGVIVGAYHLMNEDCCDVEDEEDDERLSHRERVAFLQEALQDVQTVGLDISCIAAQTSNYSQNKLERFITVLKRVRCNYTNDCYNRVCANMPFYQHNPIDMKHVRLALDEMCGGWRDGYVCSSEELFNTAVHEAGHAAATILSENFIVYLVSIISRRTSVGRNLLVWPKSMTRDDFKDKIIISLAGGVAEQVFGFDASWYARYCKSYEKEINWYALSKKDGISKGLADLCFRPSVSSDMKSAYSMASELVAWQICDKDDPDFENEICKILEECYCKTLALMQSRKDGVEQIANILLEKNIVSGHELYAVFHARRPLYEFER